MTRLALGLAVAAATGCADQAATYPELYEDRDDAALAFADPSECRECHAQHVAEWEISNHAYAMVDPVFHAMVRVGQAQSEGALGQFCVQCHSPVGLATGQTPVVFDEDLGAFSQRTEGLGPIAAQGVSCDVCHSITDVVEPVNARAVLTPDGVRRATIADPVPNEAHKSAYSELHGSSELCGMCHAVVNPKGALIEQTFGEWANSSAADRGLQCQDCHMPTYAGRAAPDAPERTLHRHTFVGVDVSLVAPDEFPGFAQMRDLTAELLRSSATMTVTASGPERRLDVSIRNLAGHALPSGATAEREMWLEVLAYDDRGRLAYDSGVLDAAGDLADGIDGHSATPNRDPQLTLFGQVMLSVDGITDPARRDELIAATNAECANGRGGLDEALEVVMFPWQANWQCDYLIAPDATAHASYDLSALPIGAYRVQVRLKFRTFPMYFLRELERLGDLDPAVQTRVPTVVMAESTVFVTLL